MNFKKPLLFLLLFMLAFSIPTRLLYAQKAELPENPPLDVKIGQMLKIGFRGMKVEESTHILRDLTEYEVGAVVLFDYDVPSESRIRNVESPAQVEQLINELESHARYRLLVTIDQEGGQVARLKPRHGFPQTVSAEFLGTSDHPDTTTRHAEQMASLLSDLGINTNLAPVVDVNLNPDNPIIGGIGRSFSADPEEVSEHAQWFVQAHHQEGVLTTLKHFPGHGSSTADSHLGMVDVTKEWSQEELIPYQRLIESGDADMIMTAHIFNENWDPHYPATLSKNVITGLLRNELGYQGVVISDDMQMGAIREHYGLETAIEQALLAGVDILSFANNSVYDEEIAPKAHQIIKKLIREGTISKDRIDESYQRIRSLKMNRL